MTDSPMLLSARLSVSYSGKNPVLQNLVIEIAPGEVLGLVGESGSGKSTLALAILGLLGRKRASVEGSVLFQGCELVGMPERDLRNMRGRSISLVLQSPLSALNPELRIGTQLKEAWRAHRNSSAKDCQEAIRSALTSVSLPSDNSFLRKFPSQLSVGQAQRVLIAMAIIHRPELLIADEPTSALDVITQSEILGLFARLNRETGMSILYISHDLLSVAERCHRIAILRDGKIVECGNTAQVFTAPKHPYTTSLVSALPRLPSKITQLTSSV